MNSNARHVDVGDTRLHVVERGEGFPVLVLHGGPGLDHHMYADYLDPLTDHYRLVLVDQRGHGLSDPAPPETWTLERLAADVSALAAALGDEPYAVLGHSYGAFVALRHAVDFSGEPAGTIVSSGLASMRGVEEGMEERLAAFGPAELREQVTAVWATEPTTPEELTSLFADQLPWQFADPRDPRIADFNARSAGMVGSPEARRHLSPEDGGIEVADRLGSVEHPVLVLGGRHDRTTPVETAEAIAHGIPGAELVIFERSGHMAYVEEQDRYLEVVRDFLDRVRR